MRSIVALAALALSGSVQLASAGPCRPSATTDLATTTTSTSAPVVTNELKGAKFARRGPDGGIVDFEDSGAAEHVDDKGYKGDGSKDSGCVQMHADSGPKRALGPNVGISQQVTGLNPSTPYTIRFYTAIVLYPQTTDSCVIRAYLGGDSFYEQWLLTSGPAVAYNAVVKQASAPASSATFSIQMQCSGGNAAMIYVDSIFMSNQVTPQNIDDYDLDFGDDDNAGSPTTTVDTETSQATSVGTEPPETETETATSTELPETESAESSQTDVETGTTVGTETSDSETATATSTEIPETESQTVTGTETSQTESAETSATTDVETSQTDVETGTTTGTETGDVETSTPAGTETSDIETSATTATKTSQTEGAETGTTTASEASQTDDVETGTTTEAQSTAESESTATSQEASESTTVSEESTGASEEATTTSEESTTASEVSTSTPTPTTVVSRICANVGSNPDDGKGCDRRPVTANSGWYFEYVGNIQKEQCAARCLAEEACGSFEWRYIDDCTGSECRLYSARLPADSPTGPAGDNNIWAYDRSCAWEIPCWQPPDDAVCLNKFHDTAEQSCVIQKATLKECAQPWLRLTVSECSPEDSCAGACATYTGCVAFSLSSDPDEQRNCLLYTDPVEEISDPNDSSLLTFTNLSCYACRGEKMALTTYAQPMEDNTPKPDNTCAAPNNANFFLATPGAVTATTLLTSTRAATTTEGPNFA